MTRKVLQLIFNSLIAFCEPVAATENALSTYSGCYMNYSAISLSLKIFCLSRELSANNNDIKSFTF